MRKRIILGLEIECVLNREIHNNLKIGEYHNGRFFNKYFTAERDGSINNNGFFNIPLCVEFVSNKLKSKKTFNNAIELFIKDISKNGLYPLKEVIAFNDSCGCHFHIGLNQENKKYYTHIDFKILKEMRNLFFKKIRYSNINEDTKNRILKHYFRDFSKELRKENYINGHVSRTTEFNILSDQNGRGLEWRSFNLNGVDSWQDFKAILNIGFECCEFLFKKRIHGYTLRKEGLKFPKKEILKKIDDLNKEEVLSINLNY